ncbi:MAG: Sec-independent protein translocase protein TatB [Pseudomonadota bacterium]
MFDIGFWELLLIAMVGLLVLGPERLPSALRSLQRTVGGIKSYSQRMQNELDNELRIKELHENLKKAEAQDFSDLSPELQRSIVELQNAAADVQRPYQKKSDKTNTDDSEDSDKQ